MHLRKALIWALPGLLAALLLSGCREGGAPPEAEAGDPSQAAGEGERSRAASPEEPGAAATKLPRPEGRSKDPRPAPGYRVATWIPGEPGKVYNPFTNETVDVLGIPSGTLVKDPADDDPEHMFRIPPLPGG